MLVRFEKRKDMYNQLGLPNIMIEEKRASRVEMLPGWGQGTTRANGGIIWNMLLKRLFFRLG